MLPFFSRKNKKEGSVPAKRLKIVPQRTTKRGFPMMADKPFLTPRLVNAVKAARDFSNSHASNSFRGMLAITDYNFRTVWANPETIKTLGYDGKTPINAYFLVHPDDEKQCSALAVAMDIQKTQVGAPLRVKRQDGSYILLDCSACPILDGENQKQGYSIYARPVSDAELIQNLIDKNKSLVSAFQLIYHDVSNLLSGVRSLLKIFSKDHIPTAGNFAVLTGDLNEAIGLIEEAHFWAVNGQVKVSPKKINVSGLVSAEINRLKQTADAKGIRISADVGEAAVFADPFMAGEILFNLLSNAIKFSPMGTGEITISAQGRGMDVQICVADNGQGIPQKIQESLFKRAVPPSSGTANEQGHGAGLVSIYKFVADNSGKLWFESEPGQGARFYFTLPKTDAHE